ncbi:MAG TPA: hypothetical protein VMH87_03590 [Pseudomonadales bacterium]|nr:hypothetical protein [Pseudomonadales bacterium]
MRKESKFVPQFFYPPMEGGRFVNAPAAVTAGETNFFQEKTARRLHRVPCCECDGAGRETIYPLVEITCHACKGKGYTLELHLRFEMP